MNYQAKMEEQIKLCNGVPKLLLHSCCAPCSSAVLERLTSFFEVTIYYYNPNITEEAEYLKRKEEQQRLLMQLPHIHPLHFLEGTYEPERFWEISNGLESEKEGGPRCLKCYYLRLEATAQKAKELEFDYFTTTLSVSPYKKADALNRVGEILEQKYQIPYLYADFKKKNGYKRSIELSKEYGLYRQDYCGCRYSYEERKNKNETAKQKL